MVTPQITDILKFNPNINVIATCTNGSAAQNRNIALSHAAIGEIVIMLDDDITGFFNGWVEELIKPLALDDVVLVSARLLKPNGSLGMMSGDNYDLSEDYVECTQFPKRVPTACIAFRNNGVTFDENYIGSGFEDDDFCRQLAKKYPKGKFIINNAVQLIHLNEMKNQKGVFWKNNKYYYLVKWNDEMDRWGE